MRIRFERDELWQMTLGSVEGRPEAVRGFLDVDLIGRCPHQELRNEESPMMRWIEELKQYLHEEVEIIISDA